MNAIENKLPREVSPARAALDAVREIAMARLRRDLADPELPADEFRKLSAVLDDFYAQVAAAEKLTFEEYRLELDERKIETSLRIAEFRASAARAKRSPRGAAAPARPAGVNAPEARDDPHENAAAPWGRKSDGNPYTHAEFRALLNQAVADIYGFDLETGAAVETSNTPSIAPADDADTPVDDADAPADDAPAPGPAP